ncbi:sigma-54-dependent transcriptional regulator [Candidatus Nitrospira nitrificans]|uniref:DNA-binding transcriptional regulator NtrC n=1 Tax=Candidatus Nitrospira nitrificans TaxID=1742973 RepID=A0A0S4L3U1_9BACT|nr:sigma-54 dependent transcriptional regulator [Candidatus Nitrospira nitrificans]CUS31240.1 Acetoacetate metabolism regulatory protein AtoC [Candidatus Nitrospira nitrificans]
MRPATILVADDDVVARELLAEALRKEGYHVEAFAGGAEVIARGRQGRVDLVLTDIRMGAVDGLTVLREFKRVSPNTAVVVLTAFGSLEGAIEAIKQGAYDYLAKPFKKEDIKLVVKRALDHCRLLQENARFREELRSKDDWSPLVGSSTAMLEVYKLVARVAESKSTVLLQGESGTGKELIARAIHANGPRRGNPFIPVNCGALPDTLLESEMFGYEKGAFTGAVGTKVGLFESANGGTLFLDEIGELGQALQVKLLRVMQDQEVRRVGSTTSTKVDVRIIAATNRDLEQLVKDGKFRDDLFYRLKVVPITLPSLAERREDIPMLVHHFLQKCAAGTDHAVRGVLPETMTLLTQYRWPGNVRELENAIERAVSLSHGPLLTPEDLPEVIRQAATAEVDARLSQADQLDEVYLTLEEVEKRHLTRVLKETKGNKVKAAKILGIDRRTLYRMAERFGLDLGEETEGAEKEPV